MLRRKLPDEIFDGRRTLPNSLFRRDDVASYLANLDRALEQTVAELGLRGTVDLFDLTRRLGHRMGLASWAGPGSARRRGLRTTGRGLRHPRRVRRVRASRCDGRRRRVGQAGRASGARRRRRGRRNRGATTWTSGDTADDRAVRPDRRRLVVGAATTIRLRGIALDVALIHIASMSNLMAALGWALGRPARAPGDTRTPVADGDSDLAQRCALESTRMAQRSIMSRAVLAPVDLDTGDVSYACPPAGRSPRCCRC